MNDLVAKFKTGEVAEPVALGMLHARGEGAPQRSGTNRLLMYMAHTSDARTYLQWKAVGRYVRKGAKALYLIRPIKVKVKGEADEDGDEGNITIRGFAAFPAFAIENTDGEPIVQETIEPPPLLEVAEAWNIPVQYLPYEGTARGSYAHGTGERITLRVAHPRTFLHELGHAAHARLLTSRGEELKGGQDPQQEAVAELTSAILGTWEGVPTAGNAYQYLTSYAEKDAAHLALQVMEDAIACADLILATAAEQHQRLAA